MAWIGTIEPKDATGALATLYEAIGSARQGVAEIHRVQSLNPRAMRAHLDLYKAVLFANSPLPRIARERIAVVVSAANECPYCISHHAEALAQLGDDPQIHEALARGEVPEAVGPQQAALLRWAHRSTVAPAEVTEGDIALVRAQGWDDRCILDASLVIAYFNFVNRLVLTLGVHIEEGFAQMCGDDPSVSE
ncbi:MAG: peroxidase-related enzyme [Deltaproteobacteria bacterium]|nr:peroxidase-related enzyme [Deltaproteobacteria bacterium]